MKKLIALLPLLVLTLILAACGGTAQPDISSATDDTLDTSTSQSQSSTEQATSEPSDTVEPLSFEESEAESYTVTDTADWCSGVTVSNIQKATHNGSCYIVFEMKFTVSDVFPGNKYYNDIYHLWEDLTNDRSNYNELTTKADIYEAFPGDVGPGNYTRSYTMGKVAEGNTEETVQWMIGGMVGGDNCERVRVTVNLTDDDNEAIITQVAVVELDLSGLQE